MDLVLGFIVFIGVMVACLLTGHSMLIALAIGLFAFTAVAFKRGYSFKSISQMAVKGAKDSIIVAEVMLVIGFVTAIWRASGTITFFVYYGVKIITPSLFLIIAFLLSCLLSYALGTSFGVAGTVGVIFMALARSGDVNILMTAGVIMSGIYFGDRGSPVSSSAVLVASCTKTKLLENVKYMMKTILIPFAITLVIYAILSFANPIHQVDASVLTALEEGFNISWWALVPALLMLLLPLLKVEILWAMAASIISGGAIAVFVQHMPLVELLKTMIVGYQTEGQLGDIINGGGLVTMLEVVGIIFLSSTYSGIFAGTGMLNDVQELLEKGIGKIGRFWLTTGISLLTICVFCNQTIATMMCNDLLFKPYEKTGGNNQELAIDLENSVIVLSGIVPWALACSVPLAFMGVGLGAMKYAYLLYLIPICYGVTKKIWFK